MPELPSSDELEISPAEVASLRKDTDSPSFRLVDCREEDEFQLCKIEGAELIPLSRFGELAPGLLLPAEGESETPVIVYCHHGMRSLHATLFLRERGLSSTWSMSGGIDQWSSEIDPKVPRY
ncbi:MAG: rhodanese-like domain-containing protein [Verrucomicrobiales bacterium]|nr:rhodanese-like domain-containing protein [Verrucomicrobiales bacterium]